ncbi:MAG: DUF4264 family protein [Acidobacteriota bacterium]
MNKKDSGKLEPISQSSFQDNPDMVRVVDFLNKSLKKKGLIFGPTRNREKMK